MSGLADAFMRIRNADGGEVAACGNATRCVAALLMREKAREARGHRDGGGAARRRGRRTTARSASIWGAPASTGGDIPLAEAADTLHLGIEAGPLARSGGRQRRQPARGVLRRRCRARADRAVRPGRRTASAVPGAHQRRGGAGAGARPHPAAGLGARRRAHPGLRHRRLRGRSSPPAGAASPTARVTVVLDGGSLRIDWLRDDHVLMTGPVATSFTGVLDPSLAG